MNNLFSLFDFFGGNFELYEHPDNPLPKCPDTPNCVRTTFKIDGDPKYTFLLCQTVLEAIGVHDLNVNQDELKISSVFKVFIFEDDFEIQLQPGEDDKTLVHVRSASRCGHYDLGVNRRRVKRFYNALQRAYNQ